MIVLYWAGKVCRDSGLQHRIVHGIQLQSVSKYAVVTLVRPHVSDLRGLSSFISGWTVWLCSFKKQSSRGTGGHSQKSVRAFSSE